MICSQRDVWQILDSRGVGGIETHVMQLAKSLEGLGITNGCAGCGKGYRCRRRATRVLDPATATGGRVLRDSRIGYGRRTEPVADPATVEGRVSRNGGLDQRQRSTTPIANSAANDGRVSRDGRADDCQDAGVRDPTA